VSGGTTKDTNPKDMIGTKKAPLSTVPAPVLTEVGLAMLEGAAKYGRHNYRAVGVRASVYFDATWRHLAAWWEGEDDDPDSGLSHVTKAIASLVIIRDAMLRGKVIDDRPPKTPDGWLARLNEKAAAILDRYAGRDPRHYTHENTSAPYGFDIKVEPSVEVRAKHAPVTHDGDRVELQRELAKAGPGFCLECGASLNNERMCFECGFRGVPISEDK
jgi:hypothetical protein